MDTEENEDQAKARKKAPPFAEREIQALVKLYCDAREEYHQKFQGASKTGPSLKQMKLKQWAHEISSLGVYERSEKQIEERLRADMKRVNKYISDMKIKLTGTGGGEGPPVKQLPHYLMPLYECLQEKQHVTGLKNIQCEEYDEPTTSRALFKVKKEPKTPPRQPFGESGRPNRKTSPQEHFRATGWPDEQRVVKSPSPIVSEGTHHEEDIAKSSQDTGRPEEVTPASAPAKKRSLKKKKTIAVRAKEALSVFTDRRSLLYDEEIRVTKLRADALEMDVERGRLELERARVELERAQMELARLRLEMERSRLELDRARALHDADTRGRPPAPSDLYRQYADL